MFKRDVKKYSSFSGEISKLVLLSKLEILLRSMKGELQITKQEDCIIISPHNEEAVDPRPDGVVVECSEAEFVEEHIEETYREMSPIFAEETQDDCTIEKEEQCEEVKVRAPKTRKYKYPINTNDKLTNDQRDWINQQVRECEVLRDGLIVYKCPICETFLRIPGSLKKHLRDTHILKPEKAQIALNDRKKFNREIQQSKLVIDIVDGSEIIWKCKRCVSNRIFRSEAGLKVHIRYSHIRNQQIPAKFISRYRIEFNDGNGKKEGWKCPECFKILKSRDGIRNHIKFEHPTLANESFSNESSTSKDIINNQWSRTANTPNAIEDYEELQNLLERKRRTLKIEANANLCKDCGIQFVNGTSKKEKSFEIHKECHKIFSVVSQYYQFPKCEVTNTIFVNNEDLEKFSSDQQAYKLFPYEGMISKISVKIKEAVGSASSNDDDLDAWKCGHCGERYLTENECNSHVMLLHSRKLICPVDHMEFEGNRGISHFNIHMKNKHSEMFPDLVIFCTYCREEFSSVFEKLAHMKHCSEKKFECDHCSSKFFTKTVLTRHLKIAFGEIAYVCEVCSKTCSSTMDLKLHRTSHTNQRLYVCSYPNCKKAFKTPAARSSHMETHANVNYCCSLCSSNFRQRAMLQRHIRKGFCKAQKKPPASFFLEEEMCEEDEQIFEVSEVLN